MENNSWEDSVFKAEGVKETAQKIMEGPVITKAAIIYWRPTKDGKFRALIRIRANFYGTFYLRPLLNTRLPTGKWQQYIVIAVGGGKLGTKSGDSYVAFALPTNILLIKNKDYVLHRKQHEF